MQSILSGGFCVAGQTLPPTAEQLGSLTPISAFFLLRGFGCLSRIDAAATTAHYGSVSAVTFIASLEAVRLAGMPSNGYLTALLTVLEVPGIIVGLLLARQSRAGGVKAALHEVITGKSIFLMIGGLVIGALCGAAKVGSVAPFFITPFKGVLCIFLLEHGMVAAGRMSDIRKAGWRMIILGCALPLLHGAVATPHSSHEDSTNTCHDRDRRAAQGPADPTAAPSRGDGIHDHPHRGCWLARGPRERLGGTQPALRMHRFPRKRGPDPGRRGPDLLRKLLGDRLVDRSQRRPWNQVHLGRRLMTLIWQHEGKIRRVHKSIVKAGILASFGRATHSP